MRTRDVGAEVPRDLPVALERDDVHGHVVLAHREVVERLAVHVDHERVADLLGGLARVVCNIPDASMATWPAGLRTMSKITDAGAGMGRVTSMRSVRKTVSGTR